MLSYILELSSHRSFPETVKRLEAAIEGNGFKVLHVHDVQRTLSGKGIDHGPYKIVEFCRAPAAKKVLDADPRFGVMLPCRMCVYEKDGDVSIVAMRPMALSALFEDSGLDELMEEVDVDIKKVLSDLN